MSDAPVATYRLSRAVGDPQHDFAEARTLSHINDLIYVCAPAPLQLGVARGLELLGPEFYSELSSAYTKKRDKICEALDRSGITPHVPQGAYYVLADTARLPGLTSKERVMHLLEQTGVASVPGSAFYEGVGKGARRAAAADTTVGKGARRAAAADENDGERLARFCFAKTDADLDEACRRLERFQS